MKKSCRPDLRIWGPQFASGKSSNPEILESSIYLSDGHQRTTGTGSRSPSSAPSWTPPASCSSARATERLDPQDRRADRVQPGCHLRLFPQQGRHLLRARRGRIPAACGDDDAGASCRLRCPRPSNASAQMFWRPVPVQLRAPAVFRADVRRSSVPRISREYERFAFAREIKARLLAHVQRCIEAGVFPRRRCRGGRSGCLRAGLLGVAVMRLSDRLATGRKPGSTRPGRARTSPWPDCSPGIAVQVSRRRCAMRRIGAPPAARTRLQVAPQRGPIMNRTYRTLRGVAGSLIASGLIGAGCGGQPRPRRRPRRRSPAGRRSVAPVAAIEQPIARFIRATGRLTAEEQADVAAETAGRVIATPVERGTPVAAGAELIRVSAAETEAQRQGGRGQRGADRGPARPERQRRRSTSKRCPKCRTRRPASSSRRASSSASRRCSSSASSRSRSSTSAGRRWKRRGSRSRWRRTARTSSIRRSRRARARITLAQKALADTVVRAPFTGVVAERMVSVGDYVTKGMKVAVVVRINPLRVQLTVPEQFVSAWASGSRSRSRSMPTRTGRSKAQVRYRLAVARDRPAGAHRRSGRAEPERRAEAGLFATARGSSRPTGRRRVLVPASAVQTARRHEPRLRRHRRSSRRAHRDDRARRVDRQVEITDGLKARRAGRDGQRGRSSSTARR